MLDFLPLPTEVRGE
jgi:hypothetical protein